MSSNKKTVFLSILSIITLAVAVVGLSYAFYNYIHSGEISSLRLGNIEFSTNYHEVILENMFPVFSEDLETDNNDIMTLTVTIRGKTEYVNGLEYTVGISDLENITNGKTVPLTLDVSASGLGTNDDNYFTNRGNTLLYKIIKEDDIFVDNVFMVGFIPSSSQETVGTITIRAYISADDVVLADTYNNLEVSDDYGTTYSDLNNRIYFTYSEWEAFANNPISFRIGIEAREGTWFNEPQDFHNVIEDKVTTAPTYVKSYEETVINNNHSTYTTQDTVGTNYQKEDVYYYTGADALPNGNVLFAGYCWQIMRTTDNGGIRLLYNGIAQNNQCKANRSGNTYKGVISASETAELGIAPYLYGDSFDYDLKTGKFHLVNPESGTRTWTFENYKSFVGKYTCKNTTGTGCTKIWHVGQYAWSVHNKVETTKYSIGILDNYQEIGTSSFNGGYSSISNVGYMYNDMYSVNRGVTTGAIYGKDVEYNNGHYLVIEDIEGSASSNTTLDEYHHYSCGILDENDIPVTTCDIVRFYFIYDANNDYYYYIELTNGEKVEDALKNMINYKQPGDNEDIDINVYSSSIKDYLEIWYDKNLKKYEGYIDTGTVYCNNRKVANLGGWNKVNGTYIESWIKFKQYSGNSDLACENDFDRFSMQNSKAKIKNSIGLITEAERRLMGVDYALTGFDYWGMSSSAFGYMSAYVRYTNTEGKMSHNYTQKPYGVRAVITLKPGTLILDGNGLDTTPYQIGPLVTIVN